MKMLSKRLQEEAMAHLINIIDALLHKEGMKQLDAVGDVASLAFIIGDEDMVKDIYKKMWGEELK